MNDDLKPSVQPVSMHGTSHPHHGYLHLVVGLLGVLLVLETIVFGYVVTQYVDLQNEQEAILEKRAESLAIRAETPVVREEKQCSETLLSNLVFNPAARDIGVQNATTTWLHEQLEEQSDSCRNVYEIVGEDQLVHGGIASDQLGDEGVLEALGDTVSDVGLKNLTKFLDSNNKRITNICTGEESVYAILFGDDYHIATVVSYDKNSEHWLPTQPVGGIMDSNVRLFADFFDTGTPLLATGYGDGGYLSWKYWAITSYGSTQLVENCVTGTGLPGFSESDGDMLVCQVEYVP